VILSDHTTEATYVDPV